MTEQATEPRPRQTIPAGVKQPTDRQEKATEPSSIRTATVRGVDVQLDTDLLDDFELMDDIARVEDGDVTRATKVLRRLLSDEDRAALMETARDPITKRIDIQAGMVVVQELFGTFDPNS